ncbi:tRNA pseudouridine(38-40) synthase TruA [Burkholderia perseverans]|uniref:tRNA pseudouridine(38-40) synthase TruA n=1 Tax=Burkholderia perseverans TaxID=2615214 RepID=UPI001FF03147|nr:tRNA pseudouridine(38-40) synthase TruA [Burkholderia perseverans]
MRIALGIQYDGAAFHGWQSQPHGNTVQDTLEQALKAFALVPLQTVVAGRTDTGVHGLGQVVHFDTDLDRTDFSWVRGTNAFLPQSVAVQWAKPMPETFHARFGAFERTYYYALYVHPVRSPMLAARAGWVHTPLDVEAMRAAAAHLIGEHDFSSFRSSECQSKTPVKHLHQIDIRPSGSFIHFRFRANAFLHHMVRNLMGCLIAVGRGRYPADWLAEVLAARNRERAAPTFPPDGLYLAHVGYPEHFAVPPAQLGSVPWSTVWADLDAPPPAPPANP